MTLWKKLLTLASQRLRPGKLSAHFHLSEFHCYDRRAGKRILLAEYPERFRETNLVRLVRALEVIRSEVQGPIRINSAYRTKAYNKKIGGVKHSQHVKAKAVDIACDIPPRTLHQIILRLIREKRIPQGGVGLYANFVHYDIRGTVARWRG
jgi:hypothetical protein